MLKSLDTFGLIMGMSQDTPAHVPDNGTHWWYSKNARFRHGRVKQMQELTAFLTLPSDTTDITNVSGFNTKQVVVSGKGLYTLRFDALTATLIAQPVGFSVDTESHYRWSLVQTRAGAYYTSPINKIIKFDGTTSSWNYSSAGPDYSGKYLANFYNHLVIANVTDGATAYPLRLAYSDIDQFSIFEPLTTNEADFYDILENPLNSLYGLGITGIHQIGDILAIFTPGSIWNMRYVGFDNGVMQFTEQIRGIGNFLPYASVAMDRYAMFVSNEDFYVYDGSTCTPIGGPIRDFFFATLATDPSLRNKTWAHVETLSQEVRWYFPTTVSTGELDGCVVFNWQTKGWYYEHGQSITAALNAGGATARSIDQLDYLAATIDSLDLYSLTIDGLDLVSVWPYSIYCPHGLGTLASETGAANGPYQVTLESRDFVIPENELVKELDSILVDADSSAYTDPDSELASNRVGWDVYVSARDYIRQPVDYTYVGTWRGYEPELRLSTGRLAARFFRFKFISRGLANVSFFGFAPNFYAGTTEK